MFHKSYQKETFIFFMINVFKSSGEFFVVCRIVYKKQIMNWLHLSVKWISLRKYTQSCQKTVWWIFLRKKKCYSKKPVFFKTCLIKIWLKTFVFVNGMKKIRDPKNLQKNIKILIWFNQFTEMHCNDFWWPSCFFIKFLAAKIYSSLICNKSLQRYKIHFPWSQL